MIHKSLVLLMVMIIVVMTGCGHEDLIVVPEHFQDYTDQWDKEGYERLYQLEEAPIYRVYEESMGVLTVIQSVDAYEEPMLILVTLDDTMVQKVEVLYENETDDYGGDYVAEPWFLDRLLLSTEQPLVTVLRKKELDHEVIAITGATITSYSVVRAVNKSIEIREAYNNENK